MQVHPVYGLNKKILEKHNTDALQLYGVKKSNELIAFLIAFI